MEQTIYAILMTKKEMKSGMKYYFYCSPETILEGKIVSKEDEVVFVDKNGTEYAIDHNEDLLENTVGYMISSDNLLKRYPNSSIEEAKSLYFADMSRQAPSRLKQMNPRDVLINHIDTKEIITGEDVIEIFYQSYDGILVSNSVEEIKAMVERLKHYYNELRQIPGISTIDINCLNMLIGVSDGILSMNELEQIRLGIITIQDNAKKTLERIVRSYDIKIANTTLTAVEDTKRI